MDLTRLRPVYEHAGPFATVYMEGRSPGEDSRNQMRLRWKSLRERLASDGAAADVLDALEAALTDEQAGEEQTNGRVLVATEDGGLVFDEAWDAALGSGDDAHYTVLPELGAYVREQARSVRMLVAISDAQGAVVRQEIVAEQHVPRDVDAETVAGSADEGVHKPRGGALKHNQIQRRAEHAAQHNAEDVVAHLRTVAASFRPRVLVLAGETQTRTVIRDALSGELADLCVEADRGDTQDNAAEQALAEQLREIASSEATRSAQARAEQLYEGLAHGQAVQGDQQVAQAAEMGAVDTLLLEHGSSLDREAFLIKQCAQTSARADLVEADTGVTDGVAALLRFPLDS